MRKLISATILSAVFALNLGAADITLDECIRLARSNYPEIKKLDIVRITEECDLSNASQSWLPSVTLGIGASWSNQNSDLNDIYANVSDEKARDYYKNLIQNQLKVLSPTPWKYNGGVEIRQNIYDGGVSAAAKSEAKAMAALQESEINYSLETVEKKVEELFFSILLLTERNKQMDSRMEVLERNKKKLSEMEAAGSGSVLAVKMVQAEIISLAQQTDILKGNLAAYRQSLSMFVGRDISSMELERPEIPDINGRSVYDTPAMKMLDSRIRVAEAQQEMIDASLRPRLAFIGNLSYGYPGNNVFKSLSSHDPVFDSVLGIKLVWDITPFYSRKNNSTKIQNQVRMLDIERESLLFNTRIENASLNSQMIRMENTLEQDEELLKLRTEIREIEEARLDNGSTDADSFLDKVSEESEAALAKSIHSIELLQYYYQCRHNGYSEQ